MAHSETTDVVNLTNNKMSELIKQVNDNTEYCQSKLLSISNDVNNLKNDILLKQRKLIETLQSNMVKIQTQQNDTNQENIIHIHIKCDLCGEYPIIGDRYKCSICSDWDCCSKCEPKHDHPLTRFKKPSQYYHNISNNDNINDQCTATNTQFSYKHNNNNNNDNDQKGVNQLSSQLATKIAMPASSGNPNELKTSLISTNEVDVKPMGHQTVDMDNKTNVICTCGTKMQRIQAMFAYKNGGSVICDGCTLTLFHELIYHCPNTSDHENGYDLCIKCGSKRISNCNPKTHSLTSGQKIQNKPCNGKDLRNCYSFDRIKNTMQQYSINSNAMNEPINTSTYKVILDDFLHLLSKHYIDKQFETITNSLGFCDVNKCAIFARNYRDRSKMVLLKDDDDKEFKETIQRQICDKIHCYYSHCFDIGNKISIKDKQLFELETKEDNMDSGFLMNKNLIERCRIIRVNNEKLIKNKEIFNNRMKMKFNQLDNKKNSGHIKDDKDAKQLQGIYSFGTKFNYGYGEEEWDDDDGIVVKQKYCSLKEELTTNKIAVITMQQFIMENEKANVHFESFYCKKNWNRLDGENKKLILKDVLAVMLYCNYDRLQYKFSKTYRDNIKEHNNFYHFGKYLKRAVTLGGTKYKKGIDSVFYHGIGEELLFPEYIGHRAKGVVIYGPLSTTTAFEVAANFTNNNNGLIIQFVYNKGLRYPERDSPRQFAVSWLSDFANESEHLFLQSNKKGSLQIENIFDPLRGYQYDAFIHALFIIESISSDHDSKSKVKNIPKTTQKLIKSILHHQLSSLSTESSKTFELSEYAKKMVETYCNNKTMIHINSKEMELEYAFIKNIWCHEKYKWIKLKRIKTLFPNIKTISLIGFPVLPLRMDDVMKELKNEYCRIFRIWWYAYDSKPFECSVEYVEKMDEFHAGKGYEFIQVLDALRTFDDIIPHKNSHFQIGTITAEIKKWMTQILHHQLLPSEPNELFDVLPKFPREMIETYFQHKRSVRIEYKKIKTECSFLMELLFQKEYEWIKLEEMIKLFPKLNVIRIDDVNLCLETLDDMVRFFSDNNNFNKMKILMHVNKDSDCSPEYAQCLYNQAFAKINYVIKKLNNYSWGGYGITVYAQ